MINIKEYLRSRKKDSGGQATNYKEKLRNHKTKVLVKGILGFSLVLIVISMMAVNWRNREFRESNIVNSVAVARVDEARHLAFGNNIFGYSKDGASCMDAKGNVLWNQTYEMQNPIVDMNETLVAIGDYNGRVIYIMNEKGRVGEITTNLPIRSFRIATNGVVATILDDSKVTRINLYDINGKELVNSETTMSKSGYPMDISVSSNGKLLAISYFYADSGMMKTSIAFHNFGEVGQNLSSDRFVSGYDYQGTVVPMIRFMNESTAFAVADDRLMFFSGSQKPVSASEKLLDEKIQSVFYNESYVGLVFLNTEGEGKYRLDIYNENGSLAVSKRFDIEYTDIIFYDEGFIIYNEKEYSINNMYGIERFYEQFDELVYLLMPAKKSNSFLLLTQDAIKTMTIK